MSEFGDGCPPRFQWSIDIHIMNASRIIRPGLELVFEPHRFPFRQLGVSVSAQLIIDLIYVLLRCVEIPVLADISNNIDREGVLEHQSHVILG